MNTKKPRNSKHTAGFSLLETLIALLVLAIGLLGLASLQTIGLKFNQQSYQRTQAVVLAYDIIDRIRANPTGKNAGLYNSVSESALPSITAGQCTTTTSPCDATAIANFDIYSWKTNIATLLAEGKGSISTTSARRTVTIRWSESGDDMQVSIEVEV